MTEDGSISRRDLLRGRFLKTPKPEPDPDSSVEPSPRPQAMLLRPPGAIRESDFLEGCTRCNDCSTACPVEAIFPAPEAFGAAAGTPMIDPMSSPCVMCEDAPCIEACEPKVLRPEVGMTMGTAVIKAMHCLAFNGTLCTVCSERCPVEGAITLNQTRPTINEDTCTGCGVCQHVCPAPYNAIAIRPDGSRYEPEAPEDGTDSAGFDWRKEYLGDRDLTPDADLGARPDGPDQS